MATLPCDATRSVAGGSFAVLTGGLTADALDLGYAMLDFTDGRSPLVVPQSIASGILGGQAFQGGLLTAALGAFLHFAILLIAAALYFGASRKVPQLASRPLLCGPLFGIAVYCWMNFLVLPLSAIPFEPEYSPGALARGLMVHMLLVGLPIALATRYGDRRAIRP